MNNALLKAQQEQGYGLAQADYKPYQPTQREQLEKRKRELTEHLRRVETALAMLDKNPSFEEVMNAVLQANY